MTRCTSNQMFRPYQHKHVLIWNYHIRMSTKASTRLFAYRTTLYERIHRWWKAWPESIHIAPLTERKRKKKKKCFSTIWKNCYIYLQKYIQIPVTLEPGIHIIMSHMQSFKDKLPYLIIYYGIDTDTMRSWIYSTRIKDTACYKIKP